jgi:MFS transporter, OFA family, oxalate/formate antiporter
LTRRVGVSGIVYYGVRIISASFVIQGVMIGGMFTYGVLFKEFEAEFGWSRAAISGASSMTLLVMGVMAMLAGRLNDRIGPRWLLTVSALFYGSGFLLFSTLSAPWQLYLFYGLLVGIGLCTNDVVTLSTVARWFTRRRGFASGVVKCGTGLGQLVIPLAVAGLVAAFGWRTACIVFGATALAIIAVAAQFMRRDPQSVGLRSGDDEPRGAPVHAAVPRLDPQAQTRAHSPLLWALCAVQFLVYCCLLTTQVHIVAHAMDLGLPRATAAGVLSTIGGVSLVGRLLVGGAIDRIGGRRALIACFTTLLASFVWLQFATASWMLFAFAALYGCAHGGFFTAMSPTVAEYFGTRVHGALFGTVLLFGSIGGALAPLAAGAVFDATGSYRIAFLALSGIALTGLIVVSLLPPMRARHAVVAAPS